MPGQYSNMELKVHGWKAYSWNQFLWLRLEFSLDKESPISNGLKKPHKQAKKKPNTKPQTTTNNNNKHQTTKNQKPHNKQTRSR